MIDSPPVESLWHLCIQISAKTPRLQYSSGMRYPGTISTVQLKPAAWIDKSHRDRSQGAGVRLRHRPPLLRAAREESQQVLQESRGQTHRKDAGVVSHQWRLRGAIASTGLNGRDYCSQAGFENDVEP